MNNSILILCLYAGAAFFTSLLGGLLPSFYRLTHRRMQSVISFIAGLMLGMSLLHFIPHSAEETHSIDRTVMWTLAGFLVMFLLQRAFHYHQHGTPDDLFPLESAPDDICKHNHVHVSSPKATELSTNKLSWMAVVLGLGFHSLLDGLALAAAVTAETHAGTGFIGLGTAMAVILHKPFDALAVMTLMQSNGCSETLRRWMNLVMAVIAPLGVVVAFLGFVNAPSENSNILGYALGFCAGSFLCIACSDLLPELHFHTHDRWLLSLSLLMGIGVSILVGQFESSGHDHNHHEDPQQHEHSPSTP